MRAVRACLGRQLKGCRFGEGVCRRGEAAPSMKRHTKKNLSTTVTGTCAAGAPARFTRLKMRSISSGKQWAQELVERRLVAACDDGGRQRADVCGTGNVHRERNLAEVVARPQHPPRHRAKVRDREHAGQDDVQAITLIAFDNGRLAAGDFLAAHPLRKLDELLAGELREQADARQLSLSRGYVPRAHGRSMRRARGSMESSTGDSSCAGSPSTAARRRPGRST